MSLNSFRSIDSTGDNLVIWPADDTIISKNLSFLNISSERLLDEFKKLLYSNGFFRLFQDKECLEIINLAFPQLINISAFKKLRLHR